jgi:hypothetical protein
LFVAGAIVGAEVGVAVGAEVGATVGAAVIEELPAVIEELFNASALCSKTQIAIAKFVDAVMSAK